MLPCEQTVLQHELRPIGIGGDGTVDLAGQARRVLQASHYFSLRAVRCHCEGNRLTLSGDVPTFYLKQMAQNVVMQLLGRTVRVHNKLQVCSPTTGAG